MQTGSALPRCLTSCENPSWHRRTHLRRRSHFILTINQCSKHQNDMWQNNCAKKRYLTFATSQFDKCGQIPLHGYVLHRKKRVKFADLTNVLLVTQDCSLRPQHTHATPSTDSLTTSYNHAGMTFPVNKGYDDDHQIWED